jgi:hypothetical protein
LVVIDLIGQIIDDLVSLISGLLQLGGLLIGLLVFSIFLYLLIIRPLLGSVLDKGKRLYWINFLVLLIFGLVLGPLMVVGITEKFPDYGFLIGASLYVLLIWLIAKPALKRENEQDNNF